MNIGIIGGNGFVGSGIRTGLERQQHSCTVISRERYDALRGSRYDILINANGNSKKYLAVQSPREEFQASVDSIQRSLLDFTYECYVLCSTVDVYGDHEHPAASTETAPIDQGTLSLYGFHKYLAELLVRRYARRWLILRCGGFVGNGLKKNSIYDLLHHVPLRVHIDSHYQYLPTETLGTIIDTLVQRNVANEIFNVCGDGCMSLREIAAEIPDADVQYAVENPPKERYEIAIDKIKSYAAIPKTTESVRAFLRQSLASV